eukprot:1817021-Amphidinium_carterae.2
MLVKELAIAARKQAVDMVAAVRSKTIETYASFGLSNACSLLCLASQLLSKAPFEEFVDLTHRQFL